MTVKDLSATEWADADVLEAADLNDTMNTKMSATYMPSAKRSVLSGLTMTGTGGQTINIAAGYYIGSDGVGRYSAGNATFALSAADATTKHRYDLITIDDAGTLTETLGTASATVPVLPACPANHTLIGYVFRAVNDNTTATNDVGDLRVLWSPVCDKIFSINLLAFTFANTASVNDLPTGNRCWFPAAYPTTYTHFRIRILTRDASDTSQIYINQNWNVGNVNDYALSYLRADSDTTASSDISTGIDYMYFALANNGYTCIFEGTMEFPTDGSNSNYTMIVQGTIGAEGADASGGSRMIQTGWITDTNAARSTSVQFQSSANAIDQFRIEVWGYK